MYKWYVKMLLQNGKTVFGVWESKSLFSDDVNNEMFCGNYSFVTFGTGKKDVVIAVSPQSIAAYWISPKPFSEQLNSFTGGNKE